MGAISTNSNRFVAGMVELRLCTDILAGDVEMLSNTNLRTPQAASYLGLSSSFLEKLRVYGGGPSFYKLGRAILYRSIDLDVWLESHRRESTSHVRAPNASTLRFI